MLPIRRAFTLIELLVVIAILAVLAGILFPVFRRVVDASKASVCVSNFHQVSIATSLYITDYEDRFIPVSSQPGEVANSRNDHTWVQVVLPYTKNFSVFHCPADPSGAQPSEATFDQDLVPGDTYSEYYTASLHVNTGYNYQYLAPILHQNGAWLSEPHLLSDVRDPSRTLMFVDSAQVSQSGTPAGGSWLVVPPCRYSTSPDGTLLDTFTLGHKADEAFVLLPGWTPGAPGTGQFGGAWPWHMGRMTVAHVDGSVKSISPGELGVGCDVQANFSGPISDPHSYMWDVN